MQQPTSRKPEQAYQMLWDCRFCGTTKLLGVDHRHCPNCGAAQDPEWRYFPSDADVKLVSDPHYQYTGVDKICPFCQQPNSAASKFCKECGGDLTNARAATVKDEIDSAKVTGKADDVVLKKFQAEQMAIHAASQRKGLFANRVLVIALIAALVICIGGVVALIALSNSTYGSSVAVNQVGWERVITVQRLETRAGSDWRSGVPSGAYNVSCTSKQRCHTESERYVCGSIRQDRGDGSYVNKDKYCSRDKQVCVPDSWCSYAVDVWNNVRDVKASGGLDDALVWPNFTPLRTNGVGAEREGGRKETLTVVFTDVNNKGKTYTFNPTNVDQWKAFKPGQRYSVEINRLEQVQWKTLKLVSAQ